MNKKQRIILVAIILILISVFIIYNLFSTASAQMAPDFTLSNGYGQTITLSKYRGKVVILNFWATWCPPCKAEIPGFISLYEKYRLKGLEIIGISIDQAGWNVVHNFIQEFEINYPVVMANRKVIQNYGGIQSIPITFIVDRKGRIYTKLMGYRNEKLFEDIISQLL
jgi:peroxiredoxin